MRINPEHYDLPSCESASSNSESASSRFHALPLRAIDTLARLKKALSELESVQEMGGIQSGVAGVCTYEKGAVAQSPIKAMPSADDGINSLNMNAWILKMFEEYLNLTNQKWLFRSIA